MSYKQALVSPSPSDSGGEATVTELVDLKAEDDGDGEEMMESEPTRDQRAKKPTKMPPTASQKAVRKAMAEVRAFAYSPAPAKLPSTADMASLKRWPLGCLKRLAMACGLNVRESAKAVQVRRIIETYRNTGAEGGGEEVGGDAVGLEDTRPGDLRAATPPTSDSDVSDGELARLEEDLAAARAAQEKDNEATMAAGRAEEAAKEAATKRLERKKRAKVLREAIGRAADRFVIPKRHKATKGAQREDAGDRDRGVGDIPALSREGGDGDGASDDGGGGGTPYGSPSRYAADGLARDGGNGRKVIIRPPLSPPPLLSTYLVCPLGR